MRILILDPSGNFGEKEGAGTTGWAVFENGELKDFGKIEAADYDCQEAYWQSVWRCIKDRDPDKVVCESYKLFGHKAKQQSGSSLDTPQLIGYLRGMCWAYSYLIIFQDPKDKVRVADEILVHMGILEQTAGGRYKALGRQTVIHERDAIRHGVFYDRYTSKKLQR
jgi:hypothetical protein